MLNKIKLSYCLNDGALANSMCSLPESKNLLKFAFCSPKKGNHKFRQLNFAAFAP